MELNYDGTSSEEEKLTSNDQPVRAESINHLNQPVQTDQNIQHADQNIQPVPTEPINQITQIDQNIQPAQAKQISQTTKGTIHHSCGHETNKRTINQPRRSG